MAHRQIERLSARQAATLTKPGRHADGGNLVSVRLQRGLATLDVSLSRTRYWAAARDGSGPAIGPKRAGLSLADARRKAAQAQSAALHRNRSPRRQEGDQGSRGTRTAPGQTFGEFADQFINSIASGFKSAVHMAQWRSTLREYASALRPMPLKDIKTDDVLEVIRPIWDIKQETASRVRQRIERILDAARAQGLRSATTRSLARQPEGAVSE